MPYSLLSTTGGTRTLGTHSSLTVSLPGGGASSLPGGPLGSTVDLDALKAQVCVWHGVCGRTWCAKLRAAASGATAHVRLSRQCVGHAPKPVVSPVPRVPTQVEAELKSQVTAQVLNDMKGSQVRGRGEPRRRKTRTRGAGRRALLCLQTPTKAALNLPLLSLLLLCADHHVHSGARGVHRAIPR